MSVAGAAGTIRRWRENVAQFAYEQFKFEPDAWQRRLFDAFPSQDPDKLRISLQACVGPGKTAVEAICGWNFLSCYGDRGEHPKGACVSITRDNLRDNLWPEFSKWQQRSEFLRREFIWTRQRIFSRTHPETWLLSARSWSKSSNADEQGKTLSGLHSKFVLVLADESGEIPLPILRAGEQALSNCQWGKIVQGGNPTSHDGMLYFAAKNPDKWHIIRITGDPDDPERSPRIGLEWAKEQVGLYGRENPWVMAHILGEFPAGSINTLLGPDEVADAMKRHVLEMDYAWAQKRLGVDCARFGDDRTVLFPRQGLAAFEPVTLRNARSHEIAARVAVARMRWNQDMTLVDDTGGWGAGTIDALLLAKIEAIGINFSGKAIDPRYFNRRSEMHWLKAQWVKRGGALPPRPGLAKEMTAPVYWFEGGKLRVEEKDQIKARLKFSPDEDDALGLTFSFPEMPGAPADPAAAMAQKISSPAGKTKDGGMWDPLAGEN